MDFEAGPRAAQEGDFETALKEWTPLAKSGNASAQYSLGLVYDNGDGIPQDHAEAVKWYRLAADQGHAIAQTNLGLMYDTDLACGRIILKRTSGSASPRIKVMQARKETSV